MDKNNNTVNTVQGGLHVGFCLGIVKGVTDTSTKVCPPKEVNVGQNVRVVLKYSQDHPEELHVNQSPLIEKALSKAFPCK